MLETEGAGLPVGVELEVPNPNEVGGVGVPNPDSMGVCGCETICVSLVLGGARVEMGAGVVGVGVVELPPNTLPPVVANPPNPDEVPPANDPKPFPVGAVLPNPVVGLVAAAPKLV